jgi:Arc/MetJ family transcription regulator
MLRMLRTVVSSRLTAPAIAVALLGAGLTLAGKAVEAIHRELADLDATRTEGLALLQGLMGDVDRLSVERDALESTVRTLTMARDRLAGDQPADGGWFDPSTVPPVYSDSTD